MGAVRGTRILLDNMNNKLKEMLAQVLRDYKENKEKEGFIPTVEMLIEELEK